MPRRAEDKTEVKRRILEATIQIFNERGLKFTVDELTSSLSMSKKTFYSVFVDKRSLFYEMVDYCFDYIRESKNGVVRSEALDLVTKIRLVMGNLTEKYENIDLSKLYILKEKYPEVYAHVAERLENDWEETIMLLEQGVREGVFRPFCIPIFKMMMETSLEQFFQNDILVRSSMTYKQGLEEVVNILLDGVVARKDQ